MAVKHNIALMHKLSGATSFAGIIESARSESNRENIRAYLNVLEEYNTYLTQSQKLYTLSFLYEQLSHNQGDVRRQAAELLGMFIVGYDRGVPQGDSTGCQIYPGGSDKPFPVGKISGTDYYSRPQEYRSAERLDLGYTQSGGKICIP